MNNRIKLLGVEPLFVVLEPGDDDAEDIFRLPGGRYLTLRFHGAHKEAKTAYIKMFQYMAHPMVLVKSSILTFERKFP